MWKKKGLKIVDGNKKPFLVMGYNLKEFHFAKRDKMKCTLRDDEFYCPKCNSARISKIDKIRIVHTNRRIGKDKLQVIIKGECIVCGTYLNRFSTNIKIKSFNRASFGSET